MRATELEWMETPDKWPRHPMLPLRRQKPGTITQWENGFLHADTGATVHLGNVFAVTDDSDVAALPKMQYNSFRAVHEDGWLVD